MRLSHGIVSGISSTLVYSVAASFCDNNNLNKTMGYMESSYSVGLTIGPIIGSVLYHYFSYKIPFYFCGILIIICIPYAQNIQEEEQQHYDINFFKVMFNPVKKLLII